MICSQEDEPVHAVPGLRSVRTEVFQDGISRRTRIVFEERFVWWKNDEAQSGVVGHVRMRREDVNAVEGRYVGEELLHDLFDLLQHVGLQIETLLAVFHLTTQVRAGVEPESGRVGVL